MKLNHNVDHLNGLNRCSQPGAREHLGTLLNDIWCSRYLALLLLGASIKVITRMLMESFSSIQALLYEHN